MPGPNVLEHVDPVLAATHPLRLHRATTHLVLSKRMGCDPASVT